MPTFITNNRKEIMAKLQNNNATFTGHVFSGMFFFDDFDTEHPELTNKVSYGPGGKGDDWVGFELSASEQVNLKDGPATLEIKARDIRNIDYDWIVKNV